MLSSKRWHGGVNELNMYCFLVASPAVHCWCFMANRPELNCLNFFLFIHRRSESTPVSEATGFKWLSLCSFISHQPSILCGLATKAGNLWLNGSLWKTYRLFIRFHIWVESYELVIYINIKRTYRHVSLILHIEYMKVDLMFSNTRGCQTSFVLRASVKKAKWNISVESRTNR